MNNSKYSSRYRFFLGLTGLLLVVNLLIGNDYITIWLGAESDLLLNAQEAAAAGGGSGLEFLPGFVLEMLYSYTGFNISYLRYISVIVLLLSFIGIYHWGRKIFGEDTVVITLLVAAASFMLTNVAKLVTADVWLFGAQALFLIFLILYIKQPIIKWLGAVVIFMLIGIAVNLVAMLIWSVGLGIYYFLLHPNKNNARSILLKVILPIASLGLICLFACPPDTSGYFLFTFGSVSYGKYLMYTFLAVLPWLGFLIAGLVDAFIKIKTREELAIISIGWLIFGLASMSMVVQLLFAYLAAKHIISYLRKPYPYEGLVKSVSLFMLLISFIVITLMLIGGWQQLGAGGYQSSLAFGALFWIFGFVGCMGLFLKEKRFIIGGFALSALLVTFAFWGRVYPLVEKFRELPRQLVEESKKKSGGQELPLKVAIGSLAERNDFKVYANAHFPDWKSIDGSEVPGNLTSSSESSILIIGEPYQLQVDTTLLQSATKVVGNIEVNKEPLSYWVLRMK